MTISCINLAEHFGGNYRLVRDPAYCAEHGARGRVDDPWLWIISGRFADICPWGHERLGVSTHGRGARANRLAALPFVTVVQDADDGLTLTFDVEHFTEVAKLAGLRRKRRLSTALLAGSHKTRFTRATAVSARKSSANASGQSKTTKVSSRSFSSDFDARQEKQGNQPAVLVPRAKDGRGAGSLNVSNTAVMAI